MWVGLGRVKENGPMSNPIIPHVIINIVFCILLQNSCNASTVLALSRARLDRMMAPQVENRRFTVAKEAGMLKYTSVECP